MQVSPEQLPARLKRGLAPVYLISGDEPLTAQECADAVRRAAQAAGFRERQVHTVEAGFDWAGLLAEVRSGSLFAERRVIDLRLPGAKPGEEGARTLAAIAADPGPDVLLLVTTGRLDKATRAARWVAVLERAGVSVTVYPIDAKQLPAWIERRMRASGLVPGPGALEALAHYTEGNALACAQEIEKLAMLGAREVSGDDIAGDLGDNARFSVYALADASLAGEAPVVLRVLRVLRAEGEAPALVSWALAREIRALARMGTALAAGRPEAQVLDQSGVWQRRKPLVRRALARTRLDEWHALVRAAARADRVVKGREAGDAWFELERLALRLGGLRAAA